MEIKGAKPGRFGPTCPACKKRFLLTVSEDPNVAPKAQAVVQKPASERVPNDIEAALGIEPPPRKVAPVRKPAPAQATVAPVKIVENAAKPQAIAKTQPPPAVPVVAPAPVARKAAPAPAHAMAANATVAIVDEPPPKREAPAIKEPVIATAEAPAEDLKPGTSLGGYQLVQKLGEGGMGSVYLARQTSLDRDVAVKVMAPFLANDPQFVARFTREAYAAAQLGHHNVVQIHDIGAERDTHFFSMEFVTGQTLAGMVSETGPLDPDVAVSYILQAARGLKFAHDHGMIHRDIKPENLLLNDQGLVKVADLGLVKRREIKETNVSKAGGDSGANPSSTTLNVAMGTPAYMAPEQANDAAGVDARADIYSLGCTLYDLLVGRPPFSGKTAVEVITKHQTQPIVPPDKIISRVPESLSQIVSKMVAKKPEERFSNMGEVIKALEEWSGIDSAKGFSPKAEHAKVIESCAPWFAKSSAAKIRKQLVRAFFLVGLLLVIGAAWFAGSMDTADGVKSKFQWTGGAIGLLVLTPLFYITLSGMTQGTHLFHKLRGLVFGARITDWLVWLLAIGMFVGALYMLNLHLAWLGFAIAAAALAAAFHFSIDQMVAKQRKEPIEHTEALIKTLRLKGLDEDSIRQFVCRYSGDDWEEFYEELFGYEEKLRAREQWGRGQKGKNRKRYATWREPLIRWIDHKQQMRKERKQRKLLEAIERKSLKAQGLMDNVAQKKAKRAADAMVFRASELRTAAATLPPPGAEKSSAKMDVNKLVQVRKPLFSDDEHESEKTEHERVHESYLKRRFGGPLGLILGPTVRFACAAALLVGFMMWMNQNNLLPTSDTAQVVKAAIDRPIVEAADPTRAGTGFKDSNMQPVTMGELPGKYKPLSFKLVPAFITNFWHNFNPGLAGLLLLLSVPFRGSKFSVAIVLAAAIAFIGERFIPLTLGPLTPDRIAMVAGGALGLFALWFWRNE